jgi:hypothetical protein
MATRRSDRPRERWSDPTRPDLWRRTPRIRADGPGYDDWLDELYRPDKRRGREDVPPNPMKGWC